MEKHERFEALCAAASIGQASGAELAELRGHLVECLQCRQAYSEFLQLGALRFAHNPSEQDLSAEEAIGCIDSVVFRERFLKQAEAEGIVFSSEKSAPAMPEPQIRRGKPARWQTAFVLTAAASAVLAAGGIGGFHWGSRAAGRSSELKGLSTGLSLRAAESHSLDQALDAKVSRLEEENRRLTAEVSSLKTSLAEAGSNAGRLQAFVTASERERSSLSSEVKERGETIDELQGRLNQAQVELTSVRSELESAKTENQATAAANEVRIRQLSDQVAEQSNALERERELLAANRDIRDLMAARNLHIADVFDTDPKGKTRAAFGRVFFTEGKSLIIYAYDLNDRRVQDAGYHYRVWGKKEGPGQSAKSLGIFYSDDKAQKRWVFKYDDPKVLSEIDSVFVTLEPPGKNLTEPTGGKFLYAYLRNQANHP